MKRLHFIPDRNNLEESIRFINENHCVCEYNDFFLASILDDKKKQLEIIDAYAKVRSDFSKDTMHGAFLDVTVHSSDAKIREISELRVRQSMDIAKEMGLYGVVFHTNRLYGFRDAVYLQNWKEMNKHFFERICEEYPMQHIFMENMFDEAPDVLCELAEEMKGYENFGICLDYAHATISDTPAREWMKQLAPYIAHLHINDNDLKNDLHAAVGDGQIDWKRFERELEEYKIDASVLIEVTGMEKQKKSIEYLKTKGVLLK
ncbi:MAG: sugar phosphate isomerase/epimerase [Agathobacter sp.]|nr:sugar phosphate isomerase/epimerase [Agathobacter sp.]